MMRPQPDPGPHLPGVGRPASQPLADIGNDLIGGPTGIAVALVRVEAAVQFHSLFVRQRQRVLILGNAVPQILYQSDSFIEWQCAQVDVHTRSISLRRVHSKSA